MQLVIGSTYESSRGFGRLLYLGETHGIDGYLPTFRTTKGEFKHYSYDQLPGALVEFASPFVSRADELIACLEGEIAKRDARIVELESDLAGTQSRVLSLQDQWRKLDAELAAIKAQEPVEYQLRALIRDVTNIPEAGYYMPQSWHDQVIALSMSGKLDAPVSEAKAQGVVMPEPELASEINRLIGLWDAQVGWSGQCMEELLDHAAKAATFIARLNATTVQQVSAPDDMRSLAQRLREYNQKPHHINPMSEAFHILVADAANALSTACVPKEIAAAITWSEHLLFECGALTSTRAPSVHVYNKTFAAVNEARAMLAAAPAAPAADSGVNDHD